MKLRVWMVLVLGLLCGGRCTAAGPRPMVGIDEERLGQRVDLSAEFVDERGQLVAMRELITRPTVLTLVYYRCPGICTPLLTDLSKVLDKIDLDPGKDFQVVTVSFDPAETPEMAAEKKQNYLDAMKRKIDPGAWRFFTGDSATIRRFTESAGFYFLRQNDQWMHAGTLIILSPEGIVTRYIPGTQFLPFDVKMAVLEAANGTVSPTVTRILRFCFSYDPEGHTYALNVTRISMVVIIGLVAIFAAVFLLRPRKSVPHS